MFPLPTCVVLFVCVAGRVGGECEDKNVCGCRSNHIKPWIYSSADKFISLRPVLQQKGASNNNHLYHDWSKCPLWGFIKWISAGLHCCTLHRARILWVIFRFRSDCDGHDSNHKHQSNICAANVKLWVLLLRSSGSLVSCPDVKSQSRSRQQLTAFCKTRAPLDVPVCVCTPAQRTQTDFGCYPHEYYLQWVLHGCPKVCGNISCQGISVGRKRNPFQWFAALMFRTE